MVAGLYGKFEHTMDDKGRVSLPAKFRKELPERVIVVPGMRGELNVFSEEDFKAWEQSLYAADGGFCQTNEMHSRTASFLHAHACNVDIDSAGRINVIPDLRKLAQLDKQIYVTGDGDHVSLWNKDVWESYKADFGFADLWTS